MKKSMKAAVMVAVGMIIRGKYTLVIKPVFAMKRLLEASRQSCSKKCPRQHSRKHHECIGMDALRLAAWQYGQI